MLIVNFEPMFPRVFLEDLLIIQYGQEIREKTIIDTRMRFTFRKEDAVWVEYIFTVSLTGELSTYCFTAIPNDHVRNVFYSRQLKLPEEINVNKLSRIMQHYVQNLIDILSAEYSHTKMENRLRIYEHDCKDLNDYIQAYFDGDV